jgi:hypothetical protein
LTAYIDQQGIGDPTGPLFRTIGRGTGKLTRPLAQAKLGNQSRCHASERLHQ